MIHQIKKILLLPIIFASLIYSQTINSIEIIGNKNFDNSDYLLWSDIQSGQQIYSGIIDSINFRISVNLNNNGFYHSKIKSNKIINAEDTSKIDIKINVAEGNPTELKNILIDHLSRIDSEYVYSLFSNLKDEIFNKYKLEDAIGESLNYYENNGNPFTEVKINSIYFYKDSSNSEYSADLHLSIDNKKKTTIDRVEIVGTKKTKDYVITRELHLLKGEKYSQKLIDLFPGRINKLGFFKPIQKPEYYINSKGEGILSFKVKEIQTNNFDGIIGYVPSSTKNQSGYVTGLLNISLRNLFGTGRSAFIKWQRLDQTSQLLDLKYMEPWAFGFPINFSTRLFQRIQDSSYVQRKLDFSLEYLATDIISFGVTLSLESVIPTVNGNARFTVFNSSIVNTGVNIKIDTRNDLYSPTNGIYFRNSYLFRKKSIDGPAQFISPATPLDVSLQKFELTFNIFHSFFKRQVVALKLHGGELRGPFFESSDLFRMGGFNSLRGYREDQFLGSRVVWSNLEYRFLLTQRTYFFLFIDNGYFQRNEDINRNIPFIKGYKTGYGLGINLETNLGILGVSFALGNGDSFSDGKIHFGIINSF